MFYKERIENLEKRVKELERKEGVSKLSEEVSKKLILALVDSNNEVVRRIFDDVGGRSIFGTDVLSPKVGGIHARNAVFSGEVFKQAVSNGISDYLKKVEEDKTEAPTIASVLEKARRNAIVGYSDLKKKYDKLLSRNKELQAEVLEVLRDKKYLEIANTSLLQETRKIRESLNERIKKLRQRLKKSSIRYRDLKESISHNGLKSV